MLKKSLASIVLGISLLSSFALWAQTEDASVVVAKLDVQQQLSISSHESGQEKFIHQVGDKNQASASLQVQESVPMSLLSALGLMVFGLMYFVLRSSRQRIK